MPDENAPPADAHWLTQALYQVRLIVKELGPWAAVAMAGFAGCQSWKNSERIDDTKNVIVGQAQEVKGELKEATEKQERKLGTIEAEVKKGK